MEASGNIPTQYPQPQLYQPQQPYPPPRKDSSWIVLTVLIIVMILLVVQVVLTVVTYLAVLDLKQTNDNGTPPPPVTVPTAQFGPCQATSNTTAEVVFAGFSTSPEPVNLKIVLQRGANSGTFSFPSNNDGVILIIESGTQYGTIRYRDYADNARVNQGDELSIYGLDPGSTYTVRMIWGPTGDILDSEEFSLPA